MRLENNEFWLDGSNGERRTVGRIALGAMVAMEAGNVCVVSVHLESHSDPIEQAEQMGHLLEAIEEGPPGGATVIGSDFNTCTLARDQIIITGEIYRLFEEDSKLFIHSMQNEPLFDIAGQAGFQWHECNEMGVSTQRQRPDGTPAPPYGRIDWFFSRGMDASSPSTIPALCNDGKMVVSDHDLSVTDFSLQL